MNIIVDYKPDDRAGYLYVPDIQMLRDCIAWMQKHLKKMEDTGRTSDNIMDFWLTDEEKEARDTKHREIQEAAKNLDE